MKKTQTKILFKQHKKRVLYSTHKDDDDDDEAV